MLILFLFVLIIGTALGNLLGSSLLSWSDTGHYLYRNAAAGKTKPPGAMFGVKQSLMLKNLTPRDNHFVIRALGLNRNRLNPTVDAAFLAQNRPTL